MDIIPQSLLAEMAKSISEDEVSEMAIPSYLHKNIAMRWMAYRRLEVLIEWMIEYRKPGINILDFGCGTGILFPTASKIADKVYGLDLQLKPARMLIEYYGFSNVHLLTPETFDNSIQDREIDLIICSEVLEHISDLASVLDQFQRKLKSDGHLIVTAPTESYLYRIGRKLAGFHGDYHVQNASTVNNNIQESSFKLVRRKYIPLPGPLAIFWALDYVK
jgi:2-polyprenyl-3-methyl-5-hydroxy-6-metoxy-1,4-benzoquinol methylase